MTPKKLKLKGFKGIRGFGRDEITLDLVALAGDAQQVALVGPNGAGKSTLLDNLQPYRLMPSRASSYSPNGFSYWDQIYGPEALKELDWEHAGVVYRSTLVFKNSGKTKKTEAYLHELRDGQMVPVERTDGTVSDGKTESYDRCVEGILGKPETFFTSAFCAQQRKMLSAYTDGEIKGLLADLLGHEKIAEIGAKAGQVVKLLMAGLEAMRGLLAKVVAAEERLPALQANVARLGKQAEQEALARKEAQTVLAKAQTELATVKAQRAAAADTETRRKDLGARHDTARRSAAERRTESEADARKEAERVTQGEAERQRLDREATQRIAALKELAEKRRALLSRKQEIGAAAAEVAKLAQQEQELVAKVEALRKIEVQASTLRTAKAQAAGKLDGLQRDGKTQSEVCEGLKKRAALAGVVPCHGTDLQPRCPLLKDAVEAQSSMVQQEEKVAQLRRQWKELADETAALDAKLAGFGDLAKAITEAEASIAAVRKQGRERQQVAALAPQLSDAEEAIKTFEQQAADLQAAMAARAEAQAKLASEAEKSIATLRQRTVVIDEDLKRVEAEVTAELAKLPAPFDESKLVAAELALAAAEKALAAIDRRLEQTQADRAATNATIATTQAEIAEGKTAKEKAARVEAEIAKWTVLSKAFSTNGIVALSIDDAGPALAGLTNDLLLACHGGRFTVSIKTQTQTAKGDLREGFDILVNDAERNESKSLKDMSGGERVWINEALTRGIALYLASESGVSYETLFSDEADGPLDPQKKQQFMRMKREVLRLGGYQREYFVSQTPELWAMADRVIDLAAL